MSFTKDLEKFQHKTIRRATDYKHAAGIALGTGIIMDTPVDTGRARGNWQITLHQAPLGTVDKTVQEALNHVSMPKNHGSLFDTVYLTNNLPYIEALEFGWSKQAPYGMVRKNVKRVQDKLDANNIGFIK